MDKINIATGKIKVNNMQDKFELYLSKQRLESYDNDIVKHKENLRFIRKHYK